VRCGNVPRPSLDVTEPVVTAVVVHFRGAGHIEPCVASCLADPAIARVIVVDNEGVAGALRAAVGSERVDVIGMEGNVGYGRAANAGLDAASTPAVIVLNQDLVLPTGTAAALLRVGADASAWVVGPALVDATGRPSRYGGGFPWPMPAPDLPRSPGPYQYVPWIAGAAMLFMPGHTALRFDPRFFMYVEDEDLCARVWSAGGRIARAQDVTVVHAAGTTTSQFWSDRQIAWRILRGRTRMVRQHRGAASAAAFAATRLPAVVRRLVIRRRR